MQRMIKPILLAAVGLVFVTTFALGYITNLLIPTIPLAAAFALAAALGPTDVVAVEAAAHRVSLPRRMMSLLSGESLINDATGIVCFQFALIAAATASFNLFHGLARFLVLAVGGLLVGIVLTILKYLLVRWLHSLGIHTSSLHISIGLLTPFIIYMAAEGLGTSGILAVFSSGIVHSLYQDKFNPEVVNLNKAQESVWSLFSFSLDGLVFVILGTHIPRIFQKYSSGVADVNGWPIAGYVLLIFLALVAIRFVWWVITVRGKVHGGSEQPMGKVKSGVIFSVAGAHGAVSMAIVLSIPIELPDGSMFPERDLIILLTGGVIVVSLLTTNFILPLLAGQKSKPSLNDTEQAARAEILSTVVERLKEAATPETRTATEIVTRNYHSRMNQNPRERRKAGGTHKRRIMDILLWEKEVILHMAEMDQLSEAVVLHSIEEVDKLIAKRDKKTGPLRLLIWTVRHFIHSLTWREMKPRKRDLTKLKEINTEIMREKLDALNITEDDPAFALIAAEHEQVVSTRLHLAKETGGRKGDSLHLFEVAANAFYIERVLIQQMMEDGRLSWKTAKEMQANITMLEARLQVE
jgi:CPA1 family monovalent cation:H+ antiporter